MDLNIPNSTQRSEYDEGNIGSRGLHRLRAVRFHLPAVFGLAADGKAEVVQTPISEEEKDGARLSAENCPVSVIEAEE